MRRSSWKSLQNEEESEEELSIASERQFVKEEKDSTNDAPPLPSLMHNSSQAVLKARRKKLGFFSEVESPFIHPFPSLNSPSIIRYANRSFCPLRRRRTHTSIGRPKGKGTVSLQDNKLFLLPREKREREIPSSHFLQRGGCNEQDWAHTNRQSVWRRGT